MKLLNKIFGAGKIKVQFIDNLTGQQIGVAEMQPEQLPETFSVSTNISLQGKEWTVEEAIPKEAAAFIRSGQLTLKLREIVKMDPRDILFTLPTISDELPDATDISAFSDFETSVREDDWRQNEFLNTTSFPLIDIEIKKIKEVWDQESLNVDDKLTAFKKCHVRNTVGMPDLVIDFSLLKKMLHVSGTGSLKMNDRFVANGFSLQTENSTYYGTIVDNKVTQLCISSWNEQTTNEILAISKQFDVVFINWYHCDIIQSDE